MANHSKPIVAAFDFDGTLTFRDSLLPFLLSIAGPFQTFINVFFEIPSFVQYAFGFLNRQGVKEALLNRFLKNMSRHELQEHAQQFSKNVLPNMIRPEGLARIAWHRNQGHRCILVSANLDIYLEPWAKSAGFQDALTSKVEFSEDEKVTGRLSGLNCRGMEKVRRLTELLGPREKYELYAYGDSKGDQELLDFADKPFYRRLTD